MRWDRRETVKKGDTYGEEIGNSSIDIQTIPSKREPSGTESFVVFDLETTGTSFIICMS